MSSLDMKIKMPARVNVQQHHDIFVHVYLSTPLGDRRIGYQRWKTNPLLHEMEKIGKGGNVAQLTTPKWVLLLPDPLLKEEVKVAASMLQLTLIFGPQKQVPPPSSPDPHYSQPHTSRLNSPPSTLSLHLPSSFSTLHTSRCLACRASASAFQNSSHTSCVPTSTRQLA